MKSKEGRSLAETPTWAVGTVISLLVAIGYLLHGCLKKLGQVNIVLFFGFTCGLCAECFMIFEVYVYCCVLRKYMES